MAALASWGVRVGALKVTVLDWREEVGSAFDLEGGWDNNRRGSAGCLPSRATGLLVGESWEAAFTEVPCVEEGAVAAVPLEDGGSTSVKGLKSEVEATSCMLTERGNALMK